MKKLFQFFNQPFQIQTFIPFRFHIGVAFSILFTVFIFLFGPVRTLDLPIEKKAIIIFSYGLICLLAVSLQMLLVPVIFKKRIREGRWKLYNHMQAHTITIVAGSVIAFIFNCGIGLSEPNLQDYLYLLLELFIFAIVPINLAVLAGYNYVLRKNLKMARELQNVVNIKKGNMDIHYQDKITLNDIHGKEWLNLKPDDLVLIRSADNYMDVFWLDGTKIQHTLLRQTMKQLEEKLSSWSFFFRCHRTCIVNLHKVTQVSGNSLGCRIKLEGIEDEIPVSRNTRQQLYGLLAEKAPLAS